MRKFLIILITSVLLIWAAAFLLTTIAVVREWKNDPKKPIHPAVLLESLLPEEMELWHPGESLVVVVDTPKYIENIYGNEDAQDEGIAQKYAIYEGDLGVAVREGYNFVYADLKAMRIKYFDNGKVIWQKPIASIRNYGSKFDTPIGEFEALTKEKNHFSTYGEVWMPYSVQFHGDFYIHGWPYYPGGKPVARGYSGGCIRLETADMEELYKL